MNLRVFLILLYVFAFSIGSFAQTEKIDSLQKVLKSQGEDTNKVNTYIALSWEKSRTDIKNSFDNAKQALNLANKINYKTGKVRAYMHIGIFHYFQGNYDSALVPYKKALEIATEINDKKLMVKALNNMGLVNAEQGKQEEALNLYFKSLDISEKSNDYKGIAGALGNIGNIYYYQNNFDKALGCFEKAIDNFKKINDKRGVANNMVSAAVVYKEKKNYKKAIEINNGVLKLYEVLQDKNGSARTYNNLGVIYNEQKDYAAAKKYYLMSLALQEEINDQRGACLSLDNLGVVCTAEKNYTEALTYFERSLKMAKEIGAIQEQTYIYKDLSDFYKNQKNFEKAFENYVLYKSVTDSILNAETTGKLNELNTKYETEKKESENKLLHTENKLSAETIKQQRIITYFIIGGFIVVSILAFFIFRGLKKQRHANTIISEQKLLVEHQKHLVEEKHKEITDSINYAERIQRSFLATKELLNENLSDYFILFKPKDVVSGDFYWAAKLYNDQFALVTADSTGHGVPGAIMSLLNITSLEKAIESYIRPSDILNSTRKTIIERLKKDGSPEGGKDGMDCSFCLFDFKKMKLTVAAAHNPVWIVRTLSSDGNKGDATITDKEVVEVKPDKMPVGKHDKDQIPFTQHEIELQKGDIVYTLTDGYPDQFGGPNGKKFMSKNLRELLVANSHLQMNEQKSLLESTLKSWIGDLEQIDDITLIGVRV